MMYFIALVVKGKLKNDNNDIPDILFVAAENKDKAIHLISTHQFEDAVWAKGKSVCRISKILDITDLSRNTVVLGKDDLHSYGKFVRSVQGVTTSISASPARPSKRKDVAPIVSVRRSRKKKV